MVEKHQENSGLFNSEILKELWGCCRSRFSNIIGTTNEVDLNILNDQVISSMEVFFPDDAGIFQDDISRVHGVR